jgi:hypothetical protein
MIFFGEIIVASSFMGVVRIFELAQMQNFTTKRSLIWGFMFQNIL